MADTISLDTAVHFVVGRGGSVRLVGDDQQLAAIGAGGVLRDIASHPRRRPAHRTSPLHRPGRSRRHPRVAGRRPEALGFYLDHDRIHVGDLTTSPTSCTPPGRPTANAGLDALMLAPTRELAAQLNQRARTEHVGRRSAAAAVDLADGNQASAGDVIITRRNDRRLRTSPTDWVKNGDRWTVHQVHRDGGLTVQHLHHGRLVRLPADYVTGQVELGYATTVHAAQGVTADTMHGLVTGDEARQQLYTMATRGRTANHLYLQVVGDGDPHSVIRPEHIRPATAVDILEAILARDDAARSATTAHRDLHDPAVRLGDATARYHDALHTAAHDIAPPELVERIDEAAEQISAGLTGEPAWPDAARPPAAAARRRPRPHPAAPGRGSGAGDRLRARPGRRPRPPPPRTPRGAGRCRGYPQSPAALGEHPDWGPYLHGRADLISNLTSQVRATTPDTPTWLPPGAGPTGRWSNRSRCGGPPPASTPPTSDPPDRRNSTGPPPPTNGHSTRRSPTAAPPPCRNGDRPSAAAGPSAAQDPFLPVLAGRLAAINRAGINARHLLAPPTRQVRCRTNTAPPRSGGGSSRTSNPPSPPASTNPSRPAGPNSSTSSSAPTAPTTLAAQPRLARPGRRRRGEPAPRQPPRPAPRRHRDRSG